MHGSIAGMILTVRNQKVMVDSDLAALYGVRTKALNQAVKRNIKRFPPEFMFKLNKKEKNELVTICDQFKKLKHSYNAPYVFTEHGAIMAAMILNTPKAVQMSVFVVKAFIKVRALLVTQKELMVKVEELEKKLVTHDHHILALVQAIKKLTEPPVVKKRRIGFEINR
jgi:phage regulator Rha-like protein